MCFFNSAEQAYEEKNEGFSPLKYLIGMQYSSQKPAQFSQVNKMLNAPSSNLDGFPSRNICVFSTQLYSRIWSQMTASPPSKP
jgi:hypothetical protein